MDNRIYICTHLKFDVPKDPVYQPVHAGHAISEDIGYPGDDTGDNISVRNRNFCELTLLYWIWKNTEHDITGICHYRRYLSKDGHPIGGTDVERLMQKYDILLPEAGLTDCASLYEQYEKYHHIEDLNITRELINEMSPEYI